MDDLNRRYYRDFYEKIHYRGLLGRFTNIYHQKIEKKHKPDAHFDRVLEIGGGTGEHLKFVAHSFSEYVLLDLAESPMGFHTIQADSRRDTIKFVLADASSIPFPDGYFDRVVSTCVLHHIVDLETALIEMRRVSKNHGVLDLYIPCDPGMMYRWLRHFTSHLKQKMSMKLTWIEVKHLWAQEHRNHFLNIYSLIKYVYMDDRTKSRRYPFAFFSWNFNLFLVTRIRISK